MKKYLELLENNFNLFMMFSFALILFLFLLLPANINATQEISLSDLAKKVQNEKVESIVIDNSSSKINIKLKDGSYLHSNKDMEVSLEQSLLYYGVSANKIENVDIKIKGNSRSVLMSLFLPFLFPIILFFILYFVILAGFKMLHIRGVPKQKISIYIFIVFLYSFFLSPAIATTVYRHIIENKFVAVFLSSIFSFLITFLILKYYFLLSRKKLWQFFLYLIAVGLFFSFVINMILYLPIMKEKNIIPQKEAVKVTSDWKIYEKENSFKFEYPKEWEIKEDNPTTGLILFNNDFESRITSELLVNITGGSVYYTSHGHTFHKSPDTITKINDNDVEIYKSDDGLEVNFLMPNKSIIQFTYQEISYKHEKINREYWKHLETFNEILSTFEPYK